MDPLKGSWGLVGGSFELWDPFLGISAQSCRIHQGSCEGVVVRKFVNVYVGAVRDRRQLPNQLNRGPDQHYFENACLMKCT